MGSLPALRRDSEACVVTTTEPKPIAEQGAETAPRVAAALDAEEPHTVLAPRGAQAAADARTIGWRQKETATASRMIPLQGAGTAQVRAMLLAEKWEEPRVFKQGGRHAAMLAGVPKEERRARIGEIAAGMNHWAIPQEEGRHLGEAVHSGLVIGKVKCKGDKAMCAHCLKNGVRTEETAVHAHYKCPKAKAVWKIVIGDWNEKAGDQVSAADVTVAQLLQACMPRRRLRGGKERMGAARTGLAPTARGHAARDLQGEVPHARGIPRDNAEQPESRQRQGGGPKGKGETAAMHRGRAREGEASKAAQP